MLRLALLSLSLLLLGSLPAVLRAQDGPVPDGAAPAGAGGAPGGEPGTRLEAAPLRKLELSRRLYEAGRDARDALLVIAGARLRKQVALSSVAREGAAPAAGFAPLGWEEMLAEAESLAGEDADLLGIIADLRAERQKGIVSGPVYSIAVLEAGLSARYGPYPFAAGRYAEVYVEGDGRSDLDLYVHDAAGRLVCADTDISDIAHCGWRPAEAGDFLLTVTNAGGHENRFALMTN